MAIHHDHGVETSAPRHTAAMKPYGARVANEYGLDSKIGECMVHTLDDFLTWMGMTWDDVPVRVARQYGMADLPIPPHTVGLM